MRTVHGRAARLLLAAALITAGYFVTTTSSSAAVPRDGWGFGISDPDPQPARSLEGRFAALDAKTFRFIVPWNAVDDPSGAIAQARERINLARAAGVQEIAVTFSRPGLPVPSRDVWRAKVTAFINEFTPHVRWWSSVNEPNHDGSDASRLGPTIAAEYSSDLASWLAQSHPEDKMISPEFADTGPIASYIAEFRRAGGRFGGAIGWHAYRGAETQSLATTNELTSAVPADLPIWVTEIGAHEADAFIGQDEAQQDQRVRWIAGTLAAQPRIWRISYYHMRDHNSRWDTALVTSGGVPRAAWYTWCAAAHGDDWLSPNCSDDWTDILFYGSARRLQTQHWLPQPSREPSVTK